LKGSGRAQWNGRVKIVVRLFAGLRERSGAERLELEVEEGLDLAGLKRELERRRPELGPLAGVRGVLGTSYVPESTRLAAGSEVALIPPVSGGSGRGDEAALRAGVFELSAAPLEPEAARARVARRTCGGTLVFVGSARERNRDKDVVRLDYEAFASMAEAEMRRIFGACRERFGPPSAPAGTDPAALELFMLVQHRTGRVEVGEPSVVVAVASPHRDAAFKAARFLIDALKRSVPLWKKELYADGGHWIGEGA
jgi:molybdopterin synthase catalytic subunit/molybdopterin converting factor small subunit